VARLFNDASSEFGVNTSVSISAMPLSMACWFNTNDLDVNEILISLADSAVGDHWFALGINGSEAGDPVQAWKRGGSSSVARTTTTPSINTWHHACGTFASATSTIAYLDGAGKHEETTSITPSSIDVTAVGGIRDVSPGQYWSGLIAEIALWNVTLTDAEVAILAVGYSPLFVRPGNLVNYWPLIGRTSPEIDVVGGVNFTLTGTVVANHPRIIMPHRQQIIPAVAAVGGVANPWYQYAQAS